MMVESAESAFYGGVAVTLHVPGMEDQSSNVDVAIPPEKVQVNQYSVGVTVLVPEMKDLNRKVDVHHQISRNADII